jgi:phosphoglucosamine mutase
VLPTPGIALLTRTLEAHGGVAFTASHNPFEDNGIKLLTASGAKFPEAREAEIEAALDGRDLAVRARRQHIGRLVTYDRAEADYVEFLCRRFPSTSTA